MNENTIQKNNSEKKEKLKMSKELRYELNKLRENCLALFNVTTSTFDGATYSLMGKYTVSEMRDIIEKWQKKGVK